MTSFGNAADFNNDPNAATFEVEAFIRAAGSYVRPSDDLRPRVLEAARLQFGERRARQWISRIAALIMLLGFFIASEERGLISRTDGPLGIAMASGFEDVFTPAEPALHRSGDGDWRMIDALTALRRQQAQLLRMSL